MNEPTPTTSPSTLVPLRCLGGRGAPRELVADAKLVLSFAGPAQQAFWRLLIPMLSDSPSREYERDIAAFAREHDIAADVLSRALRAHRFLMRQAADRRLAKEAYAEDLVAVGGSELQGRRLFEVIMPGYDLGRQIVAHDRVGAALVAHGSLLENVAWRLDETLLSEGGPIDRARVGVLTLSYRTGSQRERITLQLLPPQLEELERACRAMLGKPEEDRP